MDDLRRTGHSPVAPPRVAKAVEVILAVSVIAGAQRFLLPEAYVYACLVPFVLSIRYFGMDRATSNALLLVAIFLSVDNGAGGYAETPFFVRYPIYAWALFLITYRATFIKARVVLYCIFLCTQIALAFVNADVFFWQVFYENAILALIAGIVITRSPNSLIGFEINLHLLALLLGVFLASELVNIGYFYNRFESHYLNYNSTKALLILPTFYFLSNKKTAHALVTTSLTFIVLAGYGTRMIPVTFGLVLIGYAVFKIGKAPIPMFKTFLLIAAIFIIILSIDFSNLPLDENKVTWFFYSAAQNISAPEQLRLLDPVRYDEHILFFNRNIFSVIFGDGFGTGIRDTLNLMGSVSYDQFAFSREEIDSKIFYGLHDMWTDVGLRFGMLFVAGVVLFVARNLYVKDSDCATFAMTLFVLIFCIFYSTPGIITSAAIALALRGCSARRLLAVSRRIT